MIPVLVIIIGVLIGGIFENVFKVETKAVYFFIGFTTALIFCKLL